MPSAFFPSTESPHIDRDSGCSSEVTSSDAGALHNGQGIYRSFRFPASRRSLWDRTSHSPKIQMTSKVHHASYFESFSPIEYKQTLNNQIPDITTYITPYWDMVFILLHYHHTRKITSLLCQLQDCLPRIILDRASKWKEAQAGEVSSWDLACTSAEGAAPDFIFGTGRALFQCS